MRKNDVRRHPYMKKEQREIIEKQWNSGVSVPAIAAEIGMHNATVYRELIRGRIEGCFTADGRPAYSADKGEAYGRNALTQRKIAVSLAVKAYHAKKRTEKS